MSRFLGTNYGAVCLVGEGIALPALSPPGEYWEYEGEYIEVVNTDDTGAEWVTATATYKATGDTLDVLFGLGQGTTGECTFDSVIIRDLTTRRYEYIYGKGRKLAKVEYECDAIFTLVKVPAGERWEWKIEKWEDIGGGMKNSSVGWIKAVFKTK